MPLSAGARLGVYEVTALIGEGGMGQVYRARDTTLNRDVALKILPSGRAMAASCSIGPAGVLMSVATETAALDVGPSRLLFDGPYITSSEGRDPSYAVSPDGQRFLMMQPVRAAGAEVVVTLNWLEELKKRMATK